MEIEIKKMFFDWKKVALSLMFLMLVVGNVYLGIDDYQFRKSVASSQSESGRAETAKAAEFLNFFIEKVLNSETEVSFEDRLKLENMVRDLNDERILLIWNKFTGAETSEDVQKYCKQLLTALTEKIIG